MTSSQETDWVYFKPHNPHGEKSTKFATKYYNIAHQSLSMLQRMNFENWLRFNEVRANKIACSFLGGHGVYKANILKKDRF